MGFARSFRRQLREPSATPGYIHRVIDMFQRGQIPTGSQVLVNVHHEDTCCWWTGNKRCNCHPRIEVVQ